MFLKMDSRRLRCLKDGLKTTQDRLKTPQDRPKTASRLPQDPPDPQNSLKNHCFFDVFSIFPLFSINLSRTQFLTSSDLILEPLGLNLEMIGLFLPPFGLCWGHLWSSLGCPGVILGALVALFLSIFAPLGANSENLGPQDPSP